ncbi:unnamed protein product, partial [Ceratitis capitata]
KGDDNAKSNIRPLAECVLRVESSLAEHKADEYECASNSIQTTIMKVDQNRE